MRASIDIGSNSVLLLIGMVIDEKFQIELNLSNITALGKDIGNDKRFTDESMEATYRVLKKYKDHILKYKVEISDVIVTATEASRLATNAESFYRKVKEELGFTVNIITAEGEAFYTALGVVKGSRGNLPETIVIMDIGGASTELMKVKIDPFIVMSTISIPAGAVRGGDLKLIDEINSIDNYKTKRLIGVAGSITSIGAMFIGLNEYSDEKVSGINILTEEFISFYKRIDRLTSVELLQKYSFLGKRSSSIHNGFVIAKKIVEKIEASHLEISTFGARYGTMYNGAVDSKFLEINMT